MYNIKLPPKYMRQIEGRTNLQRHLIKTRFSTKKSYKIGKGPIENPTKQIIFIYM